MLSKVLENILDGQITNTFNLLLTKQSGFSSGHTCATALAGVVDDIINAYYINKISILVSH